MAKGPPQGDLFGDVVESRLQRSRPLAARIRPVGLDEVVGQRALLGPDGALRAAIAGDRVPSMILYGPPGSGKTTLARVVAMSTSAAFEELSAVSASVADVRAVMARARDRLAAGTRTVLFLDEIHRFNRAQQDALLPAVEDGLLTLIGATTQNPWYEAGCRPRRGPLWLERIRAWCGRWPDRLWLNTSRPSRRAGHVQAKRSKTACRERLQFRVAHQCRQAYHRLVIRDQRARRLAQNELRRSCRRPPTKRKRDNPYQALPGPGRRDSLLRSSLQKRLARSALQLATKTQSHRERRAESARCYVE